LGNALSYLTKYGHISKVEAGIRNLGQRTLGMMNVSFDEE